MKKLIIILIGTLSVLQFSCSSSETTTKKSEDTVREVVKKFVNDVTLDIEKNVSWINTMPGTEPKFHVSGKLDLLSGENYNSESTKLKYIKIYQNGEELYFIMPKVIEEVTTDLKSVTYSTIKGLSINKNLNRKEPVLFELIFIDGKKELKYRINDVLVEEVQ